ncbi:uracil-DNA glycosylase [Tsukamurella ocularis]|uniref:uracil-DNA glycosylase n=1 Tax=Tsukamurella ocularis TaxID=1970234 RepID=UPI0039F061E7
MREPTTPRALGDPRVRRERAEHVRDPHVAPINALVDRIAEREGCGALPYADPLSGGVDAEVLFVLRAPEADADPDRVGTRFLSLDNDDRVAALQFSVFREVGLPRMRTAGWNLCPFPLANPGGAPTDAEVARAIPYHREMLAMLPKLKLVVLFGAAPRDRWPRRLHRDVPTIVGASPGWPGISRPENRRSYDAAVVAAARAIGIDARVPAGTAATAPRPRAAEPRGERGARVCRGCWTLMPASGVCDSCR